MGVTCGLCLFVHDCSPAPMTFSKKPDPRCLVKLLVPPCYFPVFPLKNVVYITGEPM